MNTITVRLTGSELRVLIDAVEATLRRDHHGPLDRILLKLAHDTLVDRLEELVATWKRELDTSE